jgi:energy-coupling factor transporter ATP-binding protein EcfA2
MKIKTIEIHNYKAFYGNKNVINIDGKNLFIYGENGSGKSSLYYALKDFFQSSMETINLNEVENIFIGPADQGKVSVKITFNPDENDANNDQFMKLSSTDSPSGNINIRDASQLRSFLTYKNLLEIHYIKKDWNINLFSLLVKGVLKHFKPTGLNRSLGETWDEIEILLNTPTSPSYNITRKKRDLNTQISRFNKAFGTLFTLPTPTVPNSDYILQNAAPILQYFDKDLDINLKYNGVLLDTTDIEAKTLRRKTVSLEIKYAGQTIPKPHLFLNEARLSAIAISIYLGMIKRLPQLKKLKVLFLDDLFIGLDLSNRMPLIQILEKYFSDYQIILSTYDKPWYEVTKFYLHDNPDWKCVEFLARKNQFGYDQPIIRYADDGKNGDHIQRYIDFAEQYYNSGDNKAAGVYLRSIFEFMLKRYCKGKKLRVRFDIDISKLTTDDFWTAIKDFKSSEDARIAAGAAQQSKCKLIDTTIADVELCRRFVLNPLCHQDQTNHESSQEIQKAIEAIRKLKDELK